MDAEDSAFKLDEDSARYFLIRIMSKTDVKLEFFLFFILFMYSLSLECWIYSFGTFLFYFVYIGDQV